MFNILEPVSMVTKDHLTAALRQTDRQTGILNCHHQKSSFSRKDFKFNIYPIVLFLFIYLFIKNLLVHLFTITSFTNTVFLIY